jgi:3-methylcrotonyl-CoA carboxylase alpha subunit
MDAETREAVCGAAVRAAQAVNYENAGTIEFIADASEGLRANRIWFMEMNTRLQVEHPVTEEITGQDLVEWQLRVASGEKLPKTQDELSINGHAIEARLYAEDPAKGFLPSPGSIDDLALDHRIRIETGVEEGDAVSPHYDPMIAKLVVHATSRDEARRSLLSAMNASYVSPLRTNSGFLFECLGRQEFASGQIDTGLIERLGDELLPDGTPSQEAIDAAARRYRFDFLDWSNESLEERHRDGALFGLRLNADARDTVGLYGPNGWVVGSTKGFGEPFGISTTMTPDGDILVTSRGVTFVFRQRAVARGTTHGVHDGEIEAPMPGKVTAVEVSRGEKVAKGQRLLTLEAMKMEHALTAPFDGTVAELSAATGQQVSEGQLLVKVEAEPSAA